MGKDQALAQLLNALADVNMVDGDGWSALHWAVQLRKLSAAKLLVDFGASARQEDYEGLTPLIMAQQQKSLEFIKLFEESGALQGDVPAMGGCWFFNFFCKPSEPPLLPPTELADLK
jgi:ankyrin repeat protein